MAKTLYGSFTVAAYTNCYTYIAILKETSLDHNITISFLCQLQIELNFISLVIENVKIINKYVLVKEMNI